LFGTLISFLQIPQSELMMKHVFASLRSFINKFPVALFRGSASHCGDLCREELLDAIQELLGTIQELLGAIQELLGAIQELFGTIRELFGTIRELLGAIRELLDAIQELLGAIREKFGNIWGSLATIRELFGTFRKLLGTCPLHACAFLYLMMRSNYEFTGGSGCDRVHWQNTSFPSEVKDLTKKIHTVLQATAQMKVSQ
ncbi:predicted protein, partial [Nematostella vectensis]